MALLWKEPEDQEESDGLSWKENSMYETCSEDAIAEEHAIILDFLNVAKQTSICHLGTLPFTLFFSYLPYVIGRCPWRTWAAWVVILVIHASVAAWHGAAMGKKVLEWAEYHERLANREYFENTRALLFGQTPAPFLPCLPKYIFLMAIGAPYSIDLDLDWATAINAIRVESPEAVQTSWRQAWERIPWLGHYVGAIGLAYTMILVCVIILIIRLYQLCSLYNACVESVENWPDADDYSGQACLARFAVWHQLGAFFDVSASAFEGDVCQAVCVDLCEPWNDAEKEIGSERRHFPPGRGARFKSRVLYEATLQLWLQVSFVAHSYSSVHLKVIITGLVSVIMTFVKTIVETYLNFRRMLSLWHVMTSRATEVLQVSLVCLMTVVCAIRFIGIWYCQDHVFNMTEPGCLSLNVTIS